MTTYLSAHRHTLVALAVLVALTLLFFRPVIFSAMHYATADVRETAGAIAPLDAALKQGTYPLWNSYLFSGMPSYASVMFVPYTPASLIDLVANLPFAPPRRFALALHSLLAALGVFVYLRWHKTNVAPALLGGLAFQFSIDLVGMATGGHDTKLETIAYLPWALWSVERLLALPTPARAATLALVLGLQLLSAHVQMAYYTWLAIGLYAAYWTICGIPFTVWNNFTNLSFRGAVFAPRNLVIAVTRFPPALAGGARVASLEMTRGLRRHISALIWLLAALIAGLALAAALCLPIANYTAYSIRGGAGGLATERAVQWSLPPWELLTFIAPHLFGFGDVTYWGGLPFTSAGLYSGIIVLALAIVAVIKRPTHPSGVTANAAYMSIAERPTHPSGVTATAADTPTTEPPNHPTTQPSNYPTTQPSNYLLLLALVSILLACGNYIDPLYSLLRTFLPLYNAFRAPTLALVLAEFALAALAGLGAQKILDARTGAPSWLWRGAGALVLGAILMTLLSDPLFALMQPLYANAPMSDPIFRQALDLARLQMLLRDVWMIAFLLGSAALLIWLYLNKRLDKPAFAALLIALVVTDLWRVGSELNHPQPLAALQESPATDAVARWLRSDAGLFRVLPLQHLFGDNRWAAYDIYSAGGYHGAKMRLYQNFLDAFELPTEANPRALALLNVRWLLSPDPLDVPGVELVDRAALIYNGLATNVLIYRNTNALPRAWLAETYRLVQDEAAALAALQTDNFDPAREVVLIAPPSREPRPGAEAQVVVENYRLHEITLRVQADTPRVLVLSEVYYPQGWQATVDGVAAPILQADYLLRAVALDAGDHQVVFRFEPWDVRVGLAISIAAALVIALGFAVAVRERFGP